MTTVHKVLMTATLIVAAVVANAASPSGTPANSPVGSSKESAVPTPADMTDGEVRKIDKENKKITLKHGVIKNLDMPGMTMVFQVKDATMLDSLKTGDKIKFKAEQAGSALFVTEILNTK